MASAKAAVRLSFSKLEEQSVAPLIRELLGRLGEDPRRNGLLGTLNEWKEPFGFSPVARR